MFLADIVYCVDANASTTYDEIRSYTIFCIIEFILSVIFINIQ